MQNIMCTAYTVTTIKTEAIGFKHAREMQGHMPLLHMCLYVFTITAANPTVQTHLLKLLQFGSLVFFFLESDPGAWVGFWQKCNQLKPNSLTAH